jgi:hypothetical protein
MFSPIYNKIDTISFDNSKIKTKLCDTNHASYEVLNYDKSQVEGDDDEHTLMYRSIVICPVSKNILSFSPPKSTSMEAIEKNPSVDLPPNILANEFVEGTMINLFYDHRVNRWEISTKSGVGGEYWFFRNHYDAYNIESKQSTFRDMFMDACKCDRRIDLNSIPWFAQLPKEYSYSFVLQHPENHIMYNIAESRIYLVAAYYIDRLSSTVQYVCPYDVYNWECMRYIVNSKYMYFPITFAYNKFGITDTLDYFKSAYLNTGENSIPVAGMMFTNLNTGDRGCIMNTEYEKRKMIRGNNPNLHYHYFELVKQGKEYEFLRYFDMYNSEFNYFHQRTCDFVDAIYRAYVSFFIQKEGKNARIPKYLMYHIWKLQNEIRIPSINAGNKVNITPKVVSQYFHSMETKEMLFHINAEMREKSKK